jgi:hypothetical protein
MRRPSYSVQDPFAIIFIGNTNSLQTPFLLWNAPGIVPASHESQRPAAACSPTGVVIPIVTDTAPAYTAQQPIADAIERA